MNEYEILDAMERCPTCQRKFRVYSKTKRPQRAGKSDRLPLIRQVVAEFFRVSVDKLVGRRGEQHLAFVRQIAMYFCRQMTDASFPEIGAAFNRDHSTAIHAHKLITRRVASDMAFRISLERIERLCAPNDLAWAQLMPIQEAS